MLHLGLAAKSRVVLDMAGGNYSTMLSVRTGPTCPGTEVPLACAAGYMPDRSFLDLNLNSGDYYVQVDGYGGDSGAWGVTRCPFGAECALMRRIASCECLKSQRKSMFRP